MEKPLYKSPSWGNILISISPFFLGPALVLFMDTISLKDINSLVHKIIPSFRSFFLLIGTIILLIGLLLNSKK